MRADWYMVCLRQSSFLGTGNRSWGTSGANQPYAGEAFIFFSSSNLSGLLPVRACMYVLDIRVGAMWQPECTCVRRPVPAGANAKLLGLHPCHKPLVG